MKTDQIVRVATKYDDLLADKNVIAERQDMSSSRSTSAQRLSHSRWMCKEITLLVENGHIDKAERWVCFVQGVLWCEGLRSINEMRDDNR
jgi:hypothetical protein